MSNCVDGRPHMFGEVAESRQADHYWCEMCGAYKRVPTDGEGKDTVHLPTVMKLLKKGMMI